MTASLYCSSSIRLFFNVFLLYGEGDDHMIRVWGLDRRSGSVGDWEVTGRYLMELSLYATVSEECLDGF